MSSTKNKILFIEDSEEDYLLMLRTLKISKLEYEPSRVQTLEDLEGVLNSGETVISILDYDIPGYSIGQFLEILTEFDENLPVIVVSGTMSEDQVATALQYGARDYVMKDNLRRLPGVIKREILLHKERIAYAASKKELDKTRNMFRLYSENIDDILSLHDADGTFRYVSPSVENVYGYTPEELMGKDGRDDIHPEDLEKVLKDPVLLMQSPHQMNKIEWRRKHKEGHYIWLETKSRLLTDEREESSVILCSTREITQRKKIEEALVHSQKQFMNLVQNSSDIFTVISADFEILYQSPVFYNSFGYIQSEVVGSSFLNFIHPDEMEQVIQKLRSIVKNKNLSELFHYQFRQSNGRFRYLESKANNQLADPDINAIIINSRDISERIETESLIKSHNLGIERLYKSTIGYLALSENDNIYDYIASELSKLLPESIIAVNKLDPEENTLRCKSLIGFDKITAAVPKDLANIAVNTELDLSPTLFDSLSAAKLTKIENGLFGLLGSVFPEELCNSVEKKLRIRNVLSMGFVANNELLGSVVIIDFHSNPAINHQIAETFINIASVAIHRRNAESIIIDSLREKEVMLKEIHHRVKNNLQIISSLLELQSYQITDPETKVVFSESQNRVRTMALVHEKIYQSSDLSSINYREYIEQLIAYLSDAYHNPNVIHKIDAEDIRMSIDHAIPCGIIINELVSNSLKHAFPDQRVGRILISLKQKENTVVLRVSDNGIGLPPDFEIGNTKSLGLELVNALVHQLNAKMEIQLEEGTSFEIVFSD